MTTTDFLMRRATPDDKAEVVALCKAINEHDFIPDAYDSWMTYTGPEGFYVAEQAGRIVACFCLEFHAPGQAYLLAMRIHPDVQGKGFGTRFCQMQVEYVRSLGVQEVYLLSVLDNHRAHRTVEKNGFSSRGAWLVYDALTDLPALPAAQRARWATPDDHGQIERFRTARNPVMPCDVISSRWTCWAVVTPSPVDWELANTAVVEGEGGLEGLMLLSETEAGLLIRWLDGTPHAAADLLAFAVERMAERGLPEMAISLPMSAEPLLAPLMLNPANAFRAYVFHLAFDKPRSS